jgi:hypothetical protein
MADPQTTPKKIKDMAWNLKDCLDDLYADNASPRTIDLIEMNLLNAYNLGLEHAK